MSGRTNGLRRIPSHGVIAGVCAGIAEYFDWNVRLLRALLVIAFILSGFFPVVVAYLVFWYAIDSRPPGEPAPSYARHSDPAITAPPSMTDLKARFARLEERLGHMEECVTSNEFELRRELKKLEA